MVEGHQCHRVAHAHRKAMLKRRFVATSPNGRFTDGAAAIDGKPLQRVEVHGKNLFYFFHEDKEEPIVLHIHFGMSGFFGLTAPPSTAPPAKETTRLTLTNPDVGTAHLSAMTVKHGGLEYYQAKAADLGQDPLREDADKEALWEYVQTSKKSIGLVLMSQDIIAGVGNIYRAEILFKARVHPEQPCFMLDRATFEKVWRHSVELLQRGFVTGSILTVDKEDAARLGAPWTRRYIYNQETCGFCGTPVSVWDMAARKVYACTTCQPLLPGTQLAPARLMALGAAAPIQVFQSHCAPDDAATVPPEKMPVTRLKAELSARGLRVVGRKPVLVAALREAKAAEAAAAESEDEETGSGAAAIAALEQMPAAAGDIAELAPTTPQQPQGPKRRRVTAKTEALTPRRDKKVALDAAEIKSEGSLSFPVGEMRAQLKRLGLPSSGSREQLWARLQEHHTADTAASGGGKQVKPGTRGLGEIATAEAAAEEKRRAGESRAVEHVADGPAPATPAPRRRTHSRKS